MNEMAKKERKHTGREPLIKLNTVKPLKIELSAT